ncbi:MAG: primosomal protein N' [Alistipes sp.]|nr:primosomal protein N' [Alistipes sp.]
MLYARVVLPLAQPAYTYAFEESTGIGEGDAVIVQFGVRRYYTGIVWEVSDEPPRLGRIKSISRRLYSTPLLSPWQRRMWEWVADYYICTIGEVMRMALPSLAKPSADSAEEFSKEIFKMPTESYVALPQELSGLDGGQLQRRIAELCRRAPRRAEIMTRIAALAAEKGAADGFVRRRLIDADAALLAAMRSRDLIRTQMRERGAEAESASDFLLPQLSPAQQRACDEIRGSVAEHRPALLYGVTGSGKTEIYMHLIAETLARGGDVLMLVPEIVITSQLVERMERVFSSHVTAYHSKLTPRRRTEIYLRLASSSGGELVVGARSALFLPLTHLGLIVVDEEHDPSYKQTDTQPRYNARDCAVVMGRLSGAGVVLGSATPSLESYVNSLGGKYRRVDLTERYGEGELPEVIVSDTMRAVKRGERKVHFNKVLLDGIARTLADGGQTMLFQNRRGYAPYVECRECGWTARCPHCNVTLTLHRQPERLECHYCGYTMTPPAACPNCKTQDVSLMGFGTEKVEQEIARLFPEARVARLDRDTSTSERAFRSIVTAFENGETDIMVGTQIITKGFDFDRVSLVGILNADNLLNAPDFRSAERAFQLMMQVAGRAGRRRGGSCVVIQTSQPQHPVVRQVAAGDYEAMARQQLDERRTFKYPPYSRLTRFALRCKEYEHLREAANAMADMLRRKFGARVMGPVSSTVETVRGEHRAEIVVKIESGASFGRAREMMREVIESMHSAPEYKSVVISVDVDAQ